MSGWRPALRIAWREARRHRGRTVLIAALVALPVLVGAFIDVAMRTGDLPAAESVRRYMGSAADAYVQIDACAPISGIGYHDHRPFANSSCDHERTDEVDLAALLPPGSTWIETNLGGDANASRLSHGERSLRTLLQQLDTSSPLADGLLRLREGRFPRALGEVALTTETASALRVAPGDVVTSRQTGQVTVVGIIVEPSCLGCESAWGMPGWFRSPDAGTPDAEAGAGPVVGPGTQQVYGSYRSFLVDLPDSVDPFRLQHDLLADGVLLAPRAEALDPPPPPVDYETAVDPMGLAIAALVIGFGLIEVCLLAGTAFAVGARRQVRDLGLVAAAGGEPRHVRRIVLAQGVVTGLVGSLVALPLVILVVFLSRPWLERVSGALMGPLDVRPLELLPLVGLGVLAGLAAAMIPAFTAGRLPVLDALNRRFKSTSLAARWPRIGLILFVAGSGLAGLGSWLWLRAEQDYRRAVDGLSVQVTDQMVQVGNGPIGGPSTTPYVALLLTAFALAALGLALLAPTLVATVARAARRLPLSARMGLRDAGRHRHRTGPAVAAIMGAVAGSVALAFWAVADDDYRDRTYSWSLPEGWVQVGLYTGEEDLAPAALRDISRLAPELLPVHDVVRASSAVVPLPGGSTGNEPSYSPAWAQPVAGGCPTPDGSGSNGMVGVADSATLALVFGTVPAAVERALAEGKAVATDCALIGDGRIAFIHEGMLQDVVSKTDAPDPITVPAVLAERPRYFGIPSILLPPTSLDRLGLTAVPGQPIITTTRTPTKAEERAFADGLADRYPDADVWVQVERGYQSDNALVLSVLTGACAFVTLVGTAIAVALSAAEARSDHATLLAVGADPHRRRALAMAQAATVSLLGVGLGVVLGGIVGAAMLGADVERPLLLPWATLSQIVIGIPLLGVLIAGLFTRSRLPMVRRME
jgi:putative ABC transport system permease protein